MRDPQERFWSKVNKTETCWLWTAATRGTGYGAFSLNGRPQGAHRVAYEWEHGPVPDGLDLDHLCRVRNCVRPSHLEPVTRGVNLLRGETLLAKAAATTHCPQGHAYDAENTRYDMRGHRFCRRCKNAYQREWERRKQRRKTA